MMNPLRIFPCEPCVSDILRSDCSFSICFLSQINFSSERNAGCSSTVTCARYDAQDYTPGFTAQIEQDRTSICKILPARPPSRSRGRRRPDYRLCCQILIEEEGTSGNHIECVQILEFEAGGKKRRTVAKASAPRGEALLNFLEGTIYLSSP